MRCSFDILSRRFRFTKEMRQNQTYMILGWWAPILVVTLLCKLRQLCARTDCRIKHRKHILGVEAVFGEWVPPRATKVSRARPPHLPLPAQRFPHPGEMGHAVFGPSRACGGSGGSFYHHESHPPSGSLEITPQTSWPQYNPQGENSHSTPGLVAWGHRINEGKPQNSARKKTREAAFRLFSGPPVGTERPPTSAQKKGRQIGCQRT